MASVHKSVLVPYSAQQMFELVERVDDYAKFLPWCADARELERNGDRVLVRIDINYHGVRTHFTTANHNQSPERIVMELRHGPFRHLHGTWSFHPLAETACKVELELSYEFAAHALEKVVGPVFGRIAANLVEAFVKRAEGVYAQ